MGTALKNCTHSQTSSEIAIASSLLIDFKCVLQNAMSEAHSSSINLIRIHGLHPQQMRFSNKTMSFSLIINLSTKDKMAGPKVLEHLLNYLFHMSP